MTIKYPRQILAFSLLFLLATPAISTEQQAMMPDFSHNKPSEWINSEPLTLEQLRGKVILLDFWTFDCWNCYHSFPWLNDLQHRFENQDFIIIGVHSPEFKHEKVRANVVEKVKQFKLQHPIMLDNDFSYWKAVNNRYWPTFYVIDKQGRLQGSFVGETHKGDSRAKEIESLITRLLQQN